MSERLRDPAAYPDRAEAWEAEHHRRRCASVAPLVTDELIAEHARDPWGYRAHHSLALQRVNRLLKTYPWGGERHMPVHGEDGRWRIMVLRRDAEPALLDGFAAGTLDEAVHEIFLRRVERLREAAVA